MPLASTLKIQFSGTLSKVVNSLVTASVPVNYTKTYTWATGTGLNQADKLIILPGTVTTAAPVTIDLAASLTDVVGDSVTLAKIVMLLFVNKSTTAGQIMSVGGHATAAVSSLFGAANDLVRVGPDGCELLVNPSLAAYAVTATTADLLQIAVDAGTGVAYEVVIVGRSA